MATVTALVATPGGTVGGNLACQNCGGMIDPLPPIDGPRVHWSTGDAKCKNVCRKEIRAYGMTQTQAHAAAYEVWQSYDGSWTYYVLAKRQIDDHKPYAIWLCAVVSPHETDMAGHDTYVADVRDDTRRVK